MVIDVCVFALCCYYKDENRVETAIVVVVFYLYFSSQVSSITPILSLFERVS